MYRQLVIYGALILIISAGHNCAFSADATRRSAESLITADQSDGVLLLKNGRLLKGRIKTVSTGYLVTSNSGYLAIDGDDVRFQGADLGEIYLQLKYELKDPSIKEQLGLAEWCINQRLWVYAARELQAIKQRDPTNEGARRLLALVEAERDRGEEPTPASRLTTTPHKDVSDEEARTLGGLSGSTAQQFVGTIQPLLFNKCGNARCHGGENENSFRLTRGTSGSSHRVFAERNLANVLKHVSLEKPAESPLLNVLRGSHGGRPVLSGQSAALQQKTLTSWVEAAAKDLGGQAPVKGPALAAAREYSPDRPVKSGSLLSSAASAQFESPAGATPVRSEFGTAERTGEKLAPEKGGVKSGAKAVVPSGAADAFDPEEFNRRYAGSSGRMPAGQ